MNSHQNPIILQGLRIFPVNSFLLISYTVSTPKYPPHKYIIIYRIHIRELWKLNQCVNIFIAVLPTYFIHLSVVHIENVFTFIYFIFNITVTPISLRIPYHYDPLECNKYILWRKIIFSSQKECYYITIWYNL